MKMTAAAWWWKSIGLVVSVILLFWLFRHIDWMSKAQLISIQGRPLQPEGFFTLQAGPAMSASVDLPLTNTWSCRNFCAPTSRCALTGQQCMADIDCPGCQEPTPPYNDPMLLDPLKNAGKAKANTDAGKLTVQVTPNYSPLTQGYGTRERRVHPQKFPPPAQANFGVDVWSGPMQQQQQLFDTRYRVPPHSLQFQPAYETRRSMTGMFVEDGPLPANV